MRYRRGILDAGPVSKFGVYWSLRPREAAVTRSDGNTQYNIIERIARATHESGGCQRVHTSVTAARRFSRCRLRACASSGCTAMPAPRGSRPHPLGVDSTTCTCRNPSHPQSWHPLFSVWGRHAPNNNRQGMFYMPPERVGLSQLQRIQLSHCYDTKHRRRQRSTGVGRWWPEGRVPMCMFQQEQGGQDITAITPKGVTGMVAKRPAGREGRGTSHR